MSFEVENIDYKEIADYYYNIIKTIYKEINKGTHEPYYDKEKKCMIYSDEYLHSYGYLQRAGWRHSDIEEMEDFYDEEYFYHFGLENLSDIRNRIQHYLEDTDFKFSDSVYDYKKYDDIVIDFYQPIRRDVYNIEHSKYWNYYHSISHKQAFVNSVKWDIEWITKDFEELQELISDKEFVKNSNEKELEELSNCIGECHYKVMSMLTNNVK